jgi:hypothetical protein
MGERKYGSYSFLTLVLNGVSGQRHAPAALYPWVKDPNYPLVRGWVDIRAGLYTKARGKILCLYRGSTPVVQSVVLPAGTPSKTQPHRQRAWQSNSKQGPLWITHPTWVHIPDISCLRYYGRVVVIAFHPQGIGFKSWSGDNLSWIKSFVLFISSSTNLLVQFLKLGHDRFLPHTF